MDSNVTQQQVQAKARLSYMIGCYTFFANRVLLDENKLNKEYLHYINELLPAANAIINSDKYLSVEEYSEQEDILEQSWSIWRMQMPISRGILVFSEKILSSIGSENDYPPQLWKQFSEALIPTQTMIDNLKNSTIATDAQGKTAINALQGLVDGLKNGYFQSPEALQAKISVMDHIQNYSYQAARDTQPQKNLATVNLIGLIEKAKELVCDIKATKKDYDQITEDLCEYYTNKFLPTLCFGKPFQEKARKLYFAAAKDAHLYTAESFEKVSAAMNTIDKKCNNAYDYECTQMMKDLEDSISGLEYKQLKTATVTLSNIEATETLTVSINISGGLNLIYGNFNLFYDDRILEYKSSSRTVKTGKNSVFFRLDSADCPLNEPCSIAEITFIKKSSCQNYPIYICCEKLREEDGSLLSVITPEINTLNEDLTISFGENIINVKKHSIIPLPYDIPQKENSVFDGWYIDDKKIIEKLFVCQNYEAEPRFKPCKYGPLGKDDIAMCAWMAIHGHFAVEDDFKMLAENGIEFILMDYVHGEDKFKDQLRWAEKYGVRAYIHDYNLNRIENLTVEEIISYTSEYINSPVFLGNDVIDEPGAEVMQQLSARTVNYKKALPEYDMHINLLPNYAFGTESDFEDYVQTYLETIHADHISTDVYPLMTIHGKKQTKPNYFEGVYYTAKTARDNNLSHWVYIQLLTGMDNRAPDMVDLRFQAYVCLAFGAGKIMYYTYDVPGYTGEKQYNREVYGMRNYAHEYTELWDYAQVVNEEIILYADEYKKYSYEDSFTLRAGDIPAYVEHVGEYNSNELEITSDQSLLIGVFKKKVGDGKMYIITNASEPSLRLKANITVKPINNKKIKTFVCGEEYIGNSFTLKSGSGAMIIL
ncbi:MAG: hypothetical protein DBX47_00970 [Clostridiales bacterium]|nr:MAG: hypothetical protein DBX47_00970 [Clostridiales bacterium]